jgi:Dockerin type I domain
LKVNDSANTSRHDGEEPRAPLKLEAALKEPPSWRVFVPPAIDAAVLKAARQHLAGPRRCGVSRLRAWFVWPALAAACLMIGGLVWFHADRPAAVRFAQEDLNHDGRVDILDAFQLARQVQVNRITAPGLDLNGDGVVDGLDARFIANRAVKLEKGGKS